MTDQSPKPSASPTTPRDAASRAPRRWGRWTVPAVAVVVGAVMLALIVNGASDEADDADDSSTATDQTTTIAAATQLAAVGEVCARRTPELLETTDRVAGLTPEIVRATDSAALLALADRAEQESATLQAQLDVLQQEVAAAEVPADAVPQRDQIATTIGELRFALAVFGDQIVEVLRTGDPIAVNRYRPEGARSIAGISRLSQQLAEQTAAVPECAITVALVPTPNATTTLPTG